MRTAGSYRSVLAVRDACSLIVASAASQFGNWLFNVASLAYVYEVTHSAGWVGAATICRLLPYVLLGPVGGTIADRYDRRTVLVVGDVLRCIIMLGMAAVVGANGPVVVVIALTAAASVAGTAERPAAIALLPRLVGEARLGPANALLHTAEDVGVVTGPAVGALLLAVSSDWAAFVANGVTFAASATLISTMRTRGTPPAAGHYRESVGTQLSHGMRTARMTPYVVPLMIVIAMAELTYGVQTVQLVLYAEQRLDVGADGYGYLLAAVGFGGLLSTVFNGRLAASTRVSIIVVLTGLAFCLTQLVYASVDLLVVALIATVIGGAGFVVCEVVAETAVAAVVAADVLGRVMGVFDAVSVASMVGGAAIASVLVTATSLRTSLLSLGVATVVVTIGCRRVLRGLDVLSARRAGVLASRLAVIEQLPIAEGAPRVALEQLASVAQVCPLPEGVDVVVQGASGHTVVPVEQLGDVPAFRPELVDDAGAVVNRLRETLESCDGVLLAVPEYAGGLAGLVKNVLDRLVGSASLYHRPVVVLSAGTTGGVFAREQAIRTLSWQGALVVDNLGVAAPRTKTDIDGRFVDPETIAEIEHWANQLIASVGAVPAERLALVARVVAPYGIDPARFGELPPGRPLR